MLSKNAYVFLSIKKPIAYKAIGFLFGINVRNYTKFFT